MDRDDVGAGVERLGVLRALDAELAVALGRDERVEGEHLHPERAGPLGDELADAAEAEDAERLLVHLHPAEPAALPLAALQRRVCLRDVARLREHHRDRVLGRRDDVRLRRVRDDDALLGGRRHVDVVDADPGAADHLQALRALDHVGRQLRGRADHDRVVVGDRAGQLLLRHVGAHVHVEVLAQQIDAGVGDLLLYEDAVAVFAGHVEA